MTVLEQAKKKLHEHEETTIVLCRDDVMFTDTARGVAPMLKLINQSINLAGFSVADKIVGRAAAFLFVYAGIKEVYADVMSYGARQVLELYGISYSFQVITENIINRDGTGICPMEQAVIGCTDATNAKLMIERKLSQLHGK